MVDTEVRPVAVLAARLLTLRDDLARVHDWLAGHWPDDLPTPKLSPAYQDGQGFCLRVWCWEDGAFARAVRVLLAAVGKVDKDASGDYLNVVGRFGQVEVWITAERGQVCTRRQVGTTKEMQRDPSAPMVEVEVPVYAWDCEPLLAAEAEASSQ